MKKAVITRRAQADLDDIADYIAQRNSDRALTFSAKLSVTAIDFAIRPMSAERDRRSGPKFVASRMATT